MNKAKANYWVDVEIGLAGLVSAISGLVFLLPGDPTTGLLGLSYQAWSSLHTWSSLAAILGVGAHMALHWKWMVAMTRQMISRPKQGAGGRVPEMACAHATGTGVSRREFLVLGGAATVVAGAAVVGYKAISASAAEASQSGSQAIAAEASSGTSQMAETVQEAGVACPHNLINDPYPGRCRLYVDSNGDGICDYSVPGSGSNVASSGEVEGFSRGSRRRGGF